MPEKIFRFPGSGGTITVQANGDELAPLLDDPRFSPTPYLARGGRLRINLRRAAPSRVD